ncbi:glycosyltransferase WbuB [Saccharophagus sp. K07]|uniref:glycosyltransferase family 4 protein n=1 Tax=Saccharophagus sp. K07 TaxID=2283636 RepID=UPI001652A3D3|nr:glycosyltransferase family 4 protein [Saccharophagus sp. K07]MBC6904364.1 glycosyltransferase WbuB [Saccharophagus sp. K07]
MKIIYLHQYFNTPEMSGSTRTYEMVRRLVAAGHEVHIVTSWREQDGKKKEWFTTNEDGIVVHWYPVPYSNHMGYSRRIRAFIQFVLAASKKAASLKGDVVFACSAPLTIAIPGVIAARKNRIPMIFEVRDLWPELPIAMGALRNPVSIFLARALERWAYKSSAAVVALSPGMKDGVVKAGYPAERVAVIPNSSDNRQFAPNPEAGQAFRAARPWLGSKPLLIYAGTFGPINGVGYMVDLAEALLERNPDIRILLVGDGMERPKVIEKAKARGVYEKNLFFENQMPKKDVTALFAAADISSSLFIDIPEMRPNSANKFFDALASGTPVLINYGGWQHDLVTSRECGLAMWKKPINEVADIVAEKITDAEWCRKTGEAARQLAETMFNRDLQARQLEKVIRTAVETPDLPVAPLAELNY